MLYAIKYRPAQAALVALMLVIAAPATVSAAATCTSTSMTLPAGALYPNGIARASDGTLYVGLVTSGRILRKRPNENWETFFAGADTVFASTTLRLDEQRGLLWGNSPDFLPTGKTRPHRVFALNVSNATINRSLTLPEGGMGNDMVLAKDGTVYLTETKVGSIMRLRPNEANFQIIFRDQRLSGPNGIGAAGIVLIDDKVMAIANFGSGKLYTLSYGEETPRLSEVLLPRTIENPDGMGLAPDGSLIVLENGIKSGQGRILRIAAPSAAGMHSIEVIREGMESPVNLDITPQGCAFVSEARIRHRLLPGHEAEVPYSFRIYQLQLPLTTAN
jgi:sugar lactone lactonase YvrE